MTNKNSNSANSAFDESNIGEKITIRANDGELKEVREIVNVRSGDEIQEGTFVIETKEVKK